MPPSEIFTPKQWSTRTFAQEIDTIQICPQYPQYMVIGTWSLLKDDEPREYAGQTRKGVLQVMTVASDGDEEHLPLLAFKAYPHAIVDVRFHPKDSTLLGAATSNGSILFYRFAKSNDPSTGRELVKLLFLGSATLFDNDDEDVPAVVTQFKWLSDTSQSAQGSGTEKVQVTIAASSSTQMIRLCRITLPNINDENDPRTAQPSKYLSTILADIHKHELEAWTVAVIPRRETSLILSGADDSALIASTAQLNHEATAEDILESPPYQRWKERRTHQAGVTSILGLPLPSGYQSSTISHDNSNIIPFLTGSYDEGIRLWVLNLSMSRPSLIMELSLGGGVWRLNLIENYRVGMVMHFVVLISCCLAGCKIVRIEYDPRQEGEEMWKMEVVAEFTEGHQSLVYACDAKRDGQVTGNYTIVSTSYYDKKICVWEWVDMVRQQSDHDSPVDVL